MDGSDAGLVLCGVFLKHGNQKSRWKCHFRVIELLGHLADEGDDCFVWCLRWMRLFQDFSVCLVKELLPGGVDVGLIAVVGSFINDKAEVKV